MLYIVTEGQELSDTVSRVSTCICFTSLPKPCINRGKEGSSCLILAVQKYVFNTKIKIYENIRISSS